MTAENITITILVDNHAEPPSAREHGLSLWIQTNEGNILFDTGQGRALPLNAREFGIQLESADAMALSHGHYDHTGGVAYMLQCNPKLDVYCHPAAVQPRYSCVNGLARPIHMPRSAMSAIDKVPSTRMHWVSKPAAISESVFLTGPIPRLKGYKGGGGPFFLDPGEQRPDPIEDDMALWIETSDGLVVCVGCCHAGLVNTLEHIRLLSGIDTIAGVIGGFHLLQTDRQRIEATISDLQQLSPRSMVPCHCTGEGAMVALSNAFPTRVTQGFSGMRLAF